MADCRATKLLFIHYRHRCCKIYAILKSNRPSVGSTGTALTIAKDGAELAMATPISITTTDLVLNAIELEQAARADF